MVALGDSFIAGEGAENYLLGTATSENVCHRANSAYPFIVAERLDDRLVTAACSGAVTADITEHGQHPNSPDDILGGRPQLEALHSSDLHDEPEDVDLLVLSIGGNDAGFATVVKSCLLADCLAWTPGWMKHLDNINDDLYNTYAAIAAAVPGARKVVMTYPDLIAPGSCLGKLTAAEVAWVRMNFLPRLNAIITLQATNAGFEVVDNTSVFVGARICEDGVHVSDQAANIFKLDQLERGPLNEDLVRGSFHPKALGHQLLAQNLLRALAREPAVIEPCTPGVECPDLPPPMPPIPPPGTVEMFPQDTPCVGERVVAQEVTTVDRFVRSLEFDAAPDSRYCYREFEAQWHSDLTTARGKAQVGTGRLVDLETLSIELLTQQPDGTWRRTVLTHEPVDSPGEGGESQLERFGILAVSILILMLLLAALPWLMCRRSRRDVQ